MSRDDGSKLVTTTITEDKRLAAAIKLLDQETSIVPRGALRTTPTGAVEASRTFEGAVLLPCGARLTQAGLSEADSASLHNYLHLRPATTLPKKPLLERVRGCAGAARLTRAGQAGPDD